MRDTFYKLAIRFFNKKQFVFRFDYYDEESQKTTRNIDDTNVQQYEFINQGNNSICKINGMQIFSPDLNQVPTSVKLDIRQNEIDVGLYSYNFINGGGVVPPENKLLVISKVKASRARGEV